ncbi:hypothetical protein [Metabacillus halosaccharovorans]|nr:hypothetical protein [Metabacillus halosaccharovorans]
MKKIVAIIGDYFHRKEWIQASLEQAVTILNENQQMECTIIRVS